MITFIEDQRIVYGVESICRVLPIAPSTFYHRLACRTDGNRPIWLEVTHKSCVELIHPQDLVLLG